MATDNPGATSDSSVLAVTVAMSLIDNSSNYNIYPNPNNGHFFPEPLYELAEINNGFDIANLSGEIVYQKSASEGEYPQEIDLSGSIPGTYILMIMNNKNIIATKKIIKK